MHTLEEMRNELVRLGKINLNTIERVLKTGDHDTIDGFLAVQSAYHEMVRVRTLPNVNESMWENYEKLNITGLPEQKLFEKATKEVRKAWAGYYTNFRAVIRARWEARNGAKKVQSQEGAREGNSGSDHSIHETP